MARGINKVILIGTLGKDPDVKEVKGTTFTNISVATNETWKDKNGDKQERTEWHRVKFFGRLAEIAGEYLKKGASVYIEGSLRTEKYTDKQGVERYSTDIIAQEMQMIGGKDRSEGGERQQERPARPARSAPQPQPRGGSYGGDPAEPFPEDDIPFN